MPKRDPGAAGIAKRGSRRRHRGVLAFAAMGLFVLACLYTAYLTREIFLPIAVAIVLFIVLAPVVRWLARWWVPPPLSAAVIVSALIGSFLLAIVSLSEPIAEWRYRAPEVIAEIDRKLNSLKRSVEEVKKASKEVEEMTELAGDNDRTPEVVVKSPGLVERLLGGLQNLGAQLAIVVVLLYFLLATGEIFTEKLIKVLPTMRDKKVAVAITRQVEREVSTYLLTIALINMGFGAAVGLALYWYGLPSPFLWGAMASVLNFVPYIGAVVGVGVVTAVGLISLESLTDAMVPPLAYVGLNVIESQFITPSVLGRRFTLNPVIIFVMVIVSGWMWGMPGAFLAVPLLVILKALCDHLESLAKVGEFLRGRDA